MGSCLFTQSGAGLVSSCIWSGGLLDVSIMRCFEDVQPGGDTKGWRMSNIYGSDAGGITSPIEPCKT